jgi:hypothetical protein
MEEAARVGGLFYCKKKNGYGRTGLSPVSTARNIAPPSKPQLNGFGDWMTSDVI